MPLPARHGALPETHSVPDLLAPGLRLVFCGTALGRVSAERRAYYANPQNRFWRMLHVTGLTPEQLDPADYPRLLGHGIGLTDASKTHYGMDADLPKGAFDATALRARIETVAPRWLAFTSKNAAVAATGLRPARFGLGELPESWGPTRLYVLSSPSGANGHWDGGASWRALAELVTTDSAA